MDRMLFVILLLMTLIILLSVYKVLVTSKKINRLGNKYEKFNRTGYNQANSSESPIKSRDIDMMLSRLEKIEKNRNSMNESTNKNTLVNEIQNNIGDIDGKLSNEIFKVDNRLGQRIDKVETFLNKINKDTNSKLDQYHMEIFNELNSNVKEMKDEYKKLIDKLNQTNLSRLETFIKETEEKRENLENNLETKMKRIGDRLAFSVQKTVLHRYNALDNQVGNLSFTIVLLDQLNSGIMFTCINGRESSYTYSKAIVNGKSDHEFSPEEKIAIEKAIKNGRENEISNS